MARSFHPDLDALSELAKAFSRAYPALAPRLAERSADPDVERLIDAFSYLTEHVHRVVDESAPVAGQFFGDLVAPELSRPFPAATIVELAPPKEGGRSTFEAGCEMESIAVEGTHCPFRAWSSFEVVPWSVEDARIAWSPSEGQSLELDLTASNETAFRDEVVGSLFPLRAHLAGDSRAAMSLSLFLRCHLRQVELRIGGDENDWIPLGATVNPWGLATEHALLPPEPHEHPGFRLLREYFLMPAKLSFVEVFAEWPRPDDALALARNVSLRFRFDTQLPTALKVTKDNIRFNCVPVANVFDATTEPVRPTLERPTHALHPAGFPYGHGEAYSITRVMARVANRKGMAAIASISDFGASDTDRSDVFYVAQTEHDHRGGNEIRLSLGSPSDAAPVPDIEFLSVDVRAGNGALPNALRIGDVCVPTRSSPGGHSFRNIHAVTPYCPPARGDELRWRTLAMATTSALPSTDLETLRTLLHVLNLRPIGNAQAARAHTQRLDAILEIGVTTGHARCENDPSSENARPLESGYPRESAVLGHDVSVVLSEAGFDGEGEALSFGSVLAHLFAHEAPMGSFVRTTVKILETGRVHTFQAQNGDRTFLPERR